MEEMRRALFVLALPLVGCAHAAASAPPPEERLVLATDANVAPPQLEPLPPARPRLSQTVTLGQGSEPAYAPMPAAAAVAPSGPNVIVQNNVTVNGTPYYAGGGYYGGYYGYGYNGAAYGGGVDMSAPRAARAFPPNGWEGAQRTAPPGHTPGIGGNWAPPPSYGPRQMK